MKNTLVMAAALAMIASPAMASKARLTALGNAAHLEDIQDVFVNASKITQHGDWLTFEMGKANGSLVGTNAPATNDIGNPHAEGGFTRSMGDAKYGFYLGSTPSWVTDVRQATYLVNENPINLFYGTKAGDLAWGAGLMYSNSDRKTVKAKQSALGLNAGVTGANWDAGLNLGLTNTYKNEATAGAEVDFKGKTAIGLNAKYTMDTLTFSGDVALNGGKEETGTSPVVTTHDYDRSTYALGVVNSHKADGADFFYGASLSMLTNKDNKTADTKTETMSLPVLIGIEADATSWMVLRASVTQNFLLGSTKTTGAAITSPADEADTIGNNTSVAAGAGLKFGKLMLDGTLEAANSNTAALNGNAFLANAAVTYMF
jgi:hypothetical protein